MHTIAGMWCIGKSNIRITTKKMQISCRIAETEKQIKEYRIRCENTENQKALIEKYTHFSALDRSIVEEFIDFIEVDMIQENNEREINIHWKI